MREQYVQILLDLILQRRLSKCYFCKNSLFYTFSISFLCYHTLIKLKVEHDGLTKLQLVDPLFLVSLSLPALFYPLIFITLKHPLLPAMKYEIFFVAVARADSHYRAKKQAGSFISPLRVVIFQHYANSYNSCFVTRSHVVASFGVHECGQFSAFHPTH